MMSCRRDAHTHGAHRAKRILSNCIENHIKTRWKFGCWKAQTSVMIEHWRLNTTIIECALIFPHRIYHITALIPFSWAFICERALSANRRPTIPNSETDMPFFRLFLASNQKQCISSDCVKHESGLKLKAQPNALWHIVKTHETDKEMNRKDGIPVNFNYVVLFSGRVGISSAFSIVCDFYWICSHCWNANEAISIAWYARTPNKYQVAALENFAAIEADPELMFCLHFDQTLIKM